MSLNLVLRNYLMLSLRKLYNIYVRNTTVSKTKKALMTDPLLNKGHVHKDKQLEKDICYVCDGWGYLPEHGEDEDCHICGGSGTLWIVTKNKT
jgi:hypothetical protein